MAAPTSVIEPTTRAIHRMDVLSRFIMVTAVCAGLLWLIIAIAVRATSRARKGSPGAALIGWALLFLSAGFNPQPPPQEQVEEANRQKRIKKEAESGDPEE
jgi:hypothetical protein